MYVYRPNPKKQILIVALKKLHKNELQQTL